MDFRVVNALGGAPGGAVEPGKSPTLVLPQDFPRLSVPQQRFLSGRLLARVALNTECLDPGRSDPVSERDLEILLAALVRTEDGLSGGPTLHPPQFSKIWEGRASDTLSKQEIKAALKAAKETLENSSEQKELRGWIQSVEAGACRVGLLCCGRLDVAVTFLERNKYGLPPTY